MKLKNLVRLPEKKINPPYHEELIGGFTELKKYFESK